MSQTLAEIAFEAAPIGIVMTQDRVITVCNETFADLVGYDPATLIGQSFRMFYSSTEEFDRVRDLGLAPLRQSGNYTDERMITHRDGRSLWCRFRARSLTPAKPLEQVVMSFAPIADTREHLSLSKRQRQVLGLMARGMTSKEIARDLGLSPRTIEDVRARLLKRFAVKNATELLGKMTDLGG
ncbi:MAG: LuxR C-terminal-related transcriptional regulator [Rhodobacteraceae bacterium]|nr:LuxR C-terminal-related transcriptional regulator [Paracoccaceae bacterium]